MTDDTKSLGRRLFMTGAAAGLTAAALPAQAQSFANSTEFETPTTKGNERANISSFRLLA